MHGGGAGTADRAADVSGTGARADQLQVGDVDVHVFVIGSRLHVNLVARRGGVNRPLNRSETTARPSVVHARSAHRHRDIVDGQTMICAAMIGIGPAEEDVVAISEAEPVDREGLHGAIRGSIAVQRAGGASRDRAGKIQGRDRNSCALEIRQASGKTGPNQVRERHRLGGGRAVTPLLAGVDDCHRLDSRSRVVRKEEAPEKISVGGVSRTDRPECALDGCSRSVAIEIPGVTGSIVSNDRRAIAGARVIPPRDCAVVCPGNASARYESVEVLGYCRRQRRR